MTNGTERSVNYDLTRKVLRMRRWWRDDVVATVDQAEVIARRREDCALSARYLFMTAMAAGIAILGLLQSSPAVVIGAMLLSPLMGPIMGLGFGLAIGDYRWVRQSAISLGWGTAMAVLGCALIVFLSPLQDITSEIASRTRPTLFDLLVALFSGLAGAYAMIRGKEGAIVGVAIATALMPPLAVVGFGLATFNWTVFSGALVLYITNLVTIALTAWGLARLYGFHTELTDRHTKFQNIAMGTVFLCLVVPLGFSLYRIAWEANATRMVRGELAASFGAAARLSQPEIEFDSDPMRVSAFVWTTRLRPDAEARAEVELASKLGTKLDVQLKQFLVRDEQSAEQAQLTSAKAQEEAAANERAGELAARLSLAAGVEEDDVLIDRQRRHALVRANHLPGASLGSYAALESRIRRTEPDWRIEVVPPQADLPPVAVTGDELGKGQAEALGIAAWASVRTGTPLRVSGSERLVVVTVEALEKAGAQGVQRSVSSGPARVAWATTATD